MEFADALQTWWAPALAFAAGVVSCASPCVLPLLPGYLSFISGSRAEAADSRPLLPMLLFVLGFALVFTALGAFSKVFVPLLRSPGAQRVAGVLVVGVGAMMLLYALRIGSPALFAERRPFLSRVRPGPVSALPL
ncbi:MAG: cytochrome c biogenesis CcdA family protein, partial [Actinomycetota bacterium]